MRARAPHLPPAAAPADDAAHAAPPGPSWSPLCAANAELRATIATQSAHAAYLARAVDFVNSDVQWTWQTVLPFHDGARGVAGDAHAPPVTHTVASLLTEACAHVRRAEALGRARERADARREDGGGAVAQSRVEASAHGCASSLPEALDPGALFGAAPLRAMWLAAAHSIAPVSAGAANGDGHAAARTGGWPSACARADTAAGPGAAPRGQLRGDGEAHAMGSAPQPSDGRAPPPAAAAARPRGVKARAEAQLDQEDFLVRQANRLFNL